MDVINSSQVSYQQSTIINIPDTKHGNNSCAIYWDIENVAVHFDQPANQLIQLIRDQVIHGKGLREIEFVCVSGSGKLTSIVVDQIKSSNVKVNFVPKDQSNAADLKIIELIKQFVKTYGPGCSIVLISGDSDFTKTLIKCKVNYNVTIYLIHCEAHCNDFLDSIADELYLLSNDQLRLVTKACDVAVVRVTRFPSNLNPMTICNDLMMMFEYQGAIKNSIYFDDFDQRNICVWIGFPSKELAKLAVIGKTNQIYYNVPLIVDYIQYPPDYVVQQLTQHNVNSVREETLNTLRLLSPTSFSLSRTSLTSSTLSLPFKSSSPAYLIVTGFPEHFNYRKRRRFLSRLLSLPFRSIWCSPDTAWIRVTKPYQAKQLIDLINESNCEGSKLTVIVSKQFPGQRFNRNNLNSYHAKQFAFLIAVIVIIIIVLRNKD